MLMLGDMVYVPFYGGGLVEGIETRKICNLEYEYIIISVEIDSIKLFIPRSKLEGYKIRKISDVFTINDALKIINEKPKIMEKKWTIRYRANNKKINNGNIYSEIEVIRDLKFLDYTLVLSQGEKMILERAEKNVASELSLVFSIGIKDAYSIINTLAENSKYSI